jgi:hypothetical protein
VENFALAYKISDAISMKVEDAGGVPVVEIEFKFIRYRMLIDDEVKSKQLIQMIQDALAFNVDKAPEPVKIPNLFMRKKEGGR